MNLVGKLDYEETRLRSITARFPARIEKLFVNYTGIRVAADDHLARIYSPELLTAQRELLTAHTADPTSNFARIAREKLRLWDLMPAQIDAIVAAGQPDEEFELRAPIGGVVVTKNVQEGDYLKTGDPLFRIADLSMLWLHLNAFESDLAWLRFGQDLSFNVEAYPGETFHGRIAFIAPEVDLQTRTTAIRVNVANHDGRLKPGMLARGQVQALLSADAHVVVPELAGKWICPMHPEVITDGAGQCPSLWHGFGADHCHGLRRNQIR
ncbi:MAG: efflux RND transporter periplasmic adaptor subunit [Candidatus Synoicihabitans palmerolidicus]|nr:efflux RND transporter periplasmic adaptor subunit [Candidatus Synoicihabitans palmerolidicus]